MQKMIKIRSWSSALANKSGKRLPITRARDTKQIEFSPRPAKARTLFFVFTVLSRRGSTRPGSQANLNW